MSISVAARLAGVAEATVRAWHIRYGLAPSTSTAGGHRRYTMADVHRLRAVREMTERGILASEAARCVIDAGDDRLAAEGAAAGRTAGATVPDAAGVVGELAEAAANLDGPRMRALLQRHVAVISASSTWRDVVEPVLAAAARRRPLGTHQTHGVPGVSITETLLTHIAGTVLGDTGSPGAATTAPVSHRTRPGQATDDFVRFGLSGLVVTL